MTSEAYANITHCVLDTSTLIAIKRTVALPAQWQFMEQLTGLVRSGVLAFPKQVRQEMQRGQWPDTPGSWICNPALRCAHPEPTDECLAEVLAQIQDPLVDGAATREWEAADPYVAAMAFNLALKDGAVVAVATEDRVDRLPLKLSLATGCARINVATMDVAQFVEWADYRASKGT